MDSVVLQEKKNKYKEEIDKIVRTAYNNEQKALAKYIIDYTNEENIDAIYTFITQRVKLGFVFDSAPEVNHNCVALCERNEKLSFYGNNSEYNNNHKLIIGENYDALKNLIATYTENGEGLIDFIYIDPPYNTESTRADGNDYKSDDVKASKFMYRDKFTRTGWLNMMRERLVLAGKLLSDQGVIFISIDDTEQAYLKILCDEVFGEENFVSCIVWQDKYTTTNDKNGISSQTDYILCYCNNINNIHINKLPLREEYIKSTYTNDDNDGNGKYRLVQMYKKKNPYSYDVISPTGKIWNMPWNFARENFLQMQKENKIYWGKDGNAQPQKKVYLKDSEGINPINLLLGKEVGFSGDGGDEIEEMFNNRNAFSYPKPTTLIKYLLKIASKTDSICLDFFAGSGTTGQAVMELNKEDGGNRQCILVTNNENNIGTDICRERLYRVVNGKGSNGEEIKWTYSKDKKCLSNNCWDVFEIKNYELKIDDYEKAKELIKKSKKEFESLNANYKAKDFDIYNQLSSLKPFIKDEN